MRCAFAVWLMLGAAAVRAQDPDTAVAGAAAEARAAYVAARYDAALALWQQRLEQLGDAAPPELRANTALAALRTHRPADAERAARPLLSHDDVQWRARGAFLFGLAAWQRADTAVAAAELPDAEPMAWDLAVRHLDEAWRHWRAAAGGVPRDERAVRNAERAWRRLADVQQRRERAQRQARREPPPPPPEPTDPGEAAPPELAVQALSAAELQRLRERLQRNERDKRRVRLLPPPGAVVGERDW